MDAKAYLVVVDSLHSSPQFSQTAAACKKNFSRATIGHVFMKSRLMRLLELVSYPRIQSHYIEQPIRFDKWGGNAPFVVQMELRVSVAKGA